MKKIISVLAVLASFSAFAENTLNVSCTFYLSNETSGSGITFHSSMSKPCENNTITLEDIIAQGTISLESICGTATGYDLKLSLSNEQQVLVQTTQKKKNVFGKTKIKVLSSATLSTTSTGRYTVFSVTNDNGISCVVQY